MPCDEKVHPIPIPSPSHPVVCLGSPGCASCRQRRHCNRHAVPAPTMVSSVVHHVREAKCKIVATPRLCAAYCGLLMRARRARALDLGARRLREREGVRRRARRRRHRSDHRVRRAGAGGAVRRQGLAAGAPGAVPRERGPGRTARRVGVLPSVAIITLARVKIFPVHGQSYDCTSLPVAAI